MLNLLFCCFQHTILFLQLGIRLTNDSMLFHQILLRVNASDFNVCSRFDGFNSHSQMVMQCQPISANRFCVSISLSWFRLIFATQNSLLVLGILQQSEHLTSPSSLLTSTLCPCQKHPFTKIQVRYFFSTKSGCPGNLGELSLYLNPLLHSPFRTIISGFVSLEWIAAIVLCRCSGESLSIISTDQEGSNQYRLTKTLCPYLFKTVVGVGTSLPFDPPF